MKQKPPLSKETLPGTPLIYFLKISSHRKKLGNFLWSNTKPFGTSSNTPPLKLMRLWMRLFMRGLLDVRSMAQVVVEPLYFTHRVRKKMSFLLFFQTAAKPFSSKNPKVSHVFPLPIIAFLPNFPLHLLERARVRREERT